VPCATRASSGETEAPETGTLSIEKCLIKVVNRASPATERNGILAEIPVRDGNAVFMAVVLILLAGAYTLPHPDQFAARIRNFRAN
jgi:hypothetical protein